MAPTRSKKRKSTESQSSVDVSSFPLPQAQITAMKTRDPARTPTGRSPIRKVSKGITVNQKQALIDNLQLEITERSRKLRAQYSMQAQGLRTRIEIRVNRIPMALRKAKMGELCVKHNESGKPGNPTTNSSAVIQRKMLGSPSKNLIQENQSNVRHSPSPMRIVKRLSDEITDKENNDISNPKKRAKAQMPPSDASRGRTQTAQVLSPRSANSRTLPRSPVRPIPSPAKSYLARPISPLKPMVPTTAGGAASILTNMVEKAKSTRATASRKVTASSSASSTAAKGRGTRAAAAAPAPRAGRNRTSNTSQTTDASSGTTVVRKAASPVKRTVVGTIRGIGGAAAKKNTATKTAPPARSLRKRN